MVRRRRRPRQREHRLLGHNLSPLLDSRPQRCDGSWPSRRRPLRWGAQVRVLPRGQTCNQAVTSNDRRATSDGRSELAKHPGCLRLIALLSRRVATTPLREIEPSVDHMRLLSRNHTGSPHRELRGAETLVETTVRAVLQCNEIHRSEIGGDHCLTGEVEQPPAKTVALERLQDVNSVELRIAVPAPVPRAAHVDESDHTAVRFGHMHPIERGVEAPAEHPSSLLDRDFVRMQWSVWKRLCQERMLTSATAKLSPAQASRKVTAGGSPTNIA